MKIRIGTRVSKDWLNRPEDLKFLKQIGIDYASIVLDMVDGYDEAGGRATKEGLSDVMEKLDKADLKIERANTSGPDYINAFLGRDGGEREIENLQINAEICGEAGIPVFGIQAFQASTLHPFHDKLHSWKTGRGGYEHHLMKVRELADMPLRDDAPSHEQVWEGTLNIYRNVMPVAAQYNLNIGMHGNDPPVPKINGVPQVLYNFDAFDRLFSEVPLKNNRMTFCVGTRYESGEDIFEGIRRFGDKIIHVHFRNVKGTIPVDGEYQEVMPDEGDLNMFEVAKALDDVGYQGTLDYDHLNRISTDSPQGREYIAYCVGHTRGILQSLEALKNSK
jgi:mannonate dehydratase|tara:strand:+ start:251 stop:1252 length:1002 start_codon:yes stop_codon:yes gene_type:complete